MRRLLLAAVMLGAAAGAQAADMPDFLRGAFTEGPPAATVYWQGYYIGGQGSYGSITSKPRSGIGLPSAFVPPAWQPSGQLNGENGGGGAFAGTIRNGTMSSLASKQTICMADCARPPVLRGLPLSTALLQ